MPRIEFGVGACRDSATALRDNSGTVTKTDVRWYRLWVKLGFWEVLVLHDRWKPGPK
jgi:hypothetical protein